MEELLYAGIFEPSDSSWVAEAMLVCRKNPSELRFVFD
jgi:hypothetical protein